MNPIQLIQTPSRTTFPRNSSAPSNSLLLEILHRPMKLYPAIEILYVAENDDGRGSANLSTLNKWPKWASCFFDAVTKSRVLGRYGKQASKQGATRSSDLYRSFSAIFACIALILLYLRAFLWVSLTLRGTEFPVIDLCN